MYRFNNFAYYFTLQVPPAEIEAVLLQHPSIVDAGAIGIPDENAGEVPRAYVVLRPEAKLSEADVKEFVAEKVKIVIQKSCCTTSDSYFIITKNTIVLKTLKTNPY